MIYSGKEMVNRYEQVELFSRQEYARRLDGIRKIMKENGADVMIFPECAEETYDHWLMGRSYLELMIVPRAGEALGICMGEIDESLCKNADEADFGRYIFNKTPDYKCDGVKIVGRPSDKWLADYICSFSPSRIGVVRPENLTASLYDEIIKKVPGAEFTDLSIQVAVFKSIKSEEELDAMKVSRDMMLKVMGALPHIFRIGRTVREMETEVSNLFTEFGATGTRNGNIHYCGPMDDLLPGPAVGGFKSDPDHKLDYGDRFSALFEVNSYGHQHVAFERHYSIGEPSKGYKEAVDNAIMVHNYAVSLMKPDSLSLAQIAVKTRKFCNRHDLELFERVGWNWMHGFGAFFYDQPSLEDFTEDLPIKTGQVLHCHPMIFRTFPHLGPNAREALHLVNTYYIGPDGAEDFIGLPKELVVLFA